MNECVNCGKLKKKMAVCICKDCQDNIDNPLKWYVVLAFLIVIMIFLTFFETEVVSFIMGLCIGALIILSIKEKGEKTK